MPVSICATPHTCVECGATFLPKRTDRIYCCSSKCGRIMSGRQAAERKAAISAAKPAPALPFTPIELTTCLGCDAVFWVGGRSRRTYCTARCCTLSAQSRSRLHSLGPRACAWCSSVFDVAYGDSRIKFCSSACSRRSASKARYDRIGSDTHRKRARRAGVAYEHVKPSDIFERDGWRCQLCGVKTPKRLRGTYDPRAPEMDHIIPLALKGPHTRNNLHCACRSCNGAKGAQWQGQTLLFG